MKCVVCGNPMVNSTTTFTAMREGGVYVTEEVPCLKCSVCEHVTFTQEVARQLERYSSGRRLPVATYRAWVFRWGVPIVEIPKITFPSSINERVEIETPGTIGVPVS
ncbi:MAG: YgiT-type zinc finger protein [Chloroflexota bacterium]